MKKLILVAVALSVIVPSASAGGLVPGPHTDTDRERYVLGRIVELSLWNNGPSDVTLESPWTITDVRQERQVSHYDFSDEHLTLEPGEEVVWRWLQDDACYGICQNVRAGEPVGPSIYEAAVETSAGTLSTRFQTGQYFTLGFEGRPLASFVVYVNTPDEVEQMEAEAAAADKTLIVSGFVKKRMRYNRPWHFTMGPGSIVLGEVFIEVCDGSPNYVERHRQEWRGERWCPWSSFVEKVGR